MPIHEYCCGACAHRFEALLGRGEEDAPACPACGASRVERTPSTFTVGRGSRPAPMGRCGPGDCACRRE